MGKTKVFISYCSEDKDKKDYLKELMSKSNVLEPIVVPEESSNLDYSSEKIIKYLDKATLFVPIITMNSINNQWVNQEIGYIFGKKTKNEKIKPIVENQTKDYLKGFIGFDKDLNFRFNNTEEFKSQVEILINILEAEYKNKGKYMIG